MHLIKLSAIASTNSYLKELNSEIPLNDETVVCANSQLSGRGQRGASWYSEPGKSLTFSLLKRYSQLPTEQSVAINLAVSLSVASVLDSLEVPEVSVKWPNDIMSANKKIAGILIENQLQGENIVSSVIGIGINVNNKNFADLPNAGSLLLATGKAYDLDLVIETVGESVFEELRNIHSAPFEIIHSKYESRLFRKGIISEFKRADGTRFNGRIAGVNRSGDLVVELESGVSEKFQLKEIELLL
ncbi:biotin--[acetyl-CoA-carboxylase] ligase [Aureitalea sp. L0-47]|uniref:biotin--[acetyl-CoA-carboxylase] ligase n=1 Tax=Aureitalea sp. L0-47 TaxID=2816962 RepID=UPI00223746FB|nr:biotin--[acetyl-CoA-carboxylase] ligase [Aureitalea sp. L0-47]MCW5519302.1 biotin--[acetyl-CoA-carboxylase] ligase [Aureitalea sp. L0-47]